MYIPNVGQATITMFNCLSIDKEEIFVLFPRRRVTSAQMGQALNILMEFIPKMKWGSHICISNEVNVSSFAKFLNNAWYWVTTDSCRNDTFSVWLCASKQPYFRLLTLQMPGAYGTHIASHFIIPHDVNKMPRKARNDGVVGQSWAGVLFD